MTTMALGAWLRDFDDPERRQRVWDLGLVTGLRRSSGGGFRAANFERGLVLDRIVEQRRPRTVLEIGTGRGLGSFAMAAAARAYGVSVAITTVDALPISESQDFALEVDGRPQEVRASCAEIWNAHLDQELVGRVTPLTGRTTTVLPHLLRTDRTFDFVFIDAGHDLFSVVHDLCYATQLLSPGGSILMDDVAPLEAFGLGTCIALTHARRLFARVEVFPTEGVVYGGAVYPDAPRGMAFLSECRSSVRVRRWLFPAWWVAGAVLARCYGARLFPADTPRTP